MYGVYLPIDLGVILASLSASVNHRGAFLEIFVADWLEPKIRKGLHRDQLEEEALNSGLKKRAGCQWALLDYFRRQMFIYS